MRSHAEGGVTGGSSPLRKIRCRNGVVFLYLTETPPVELFQANGFCKTDDNGIL